MGGWGCGAVPATPAGTAGWQRRNRGCSGCARTPESCGWGWGEIPEIGYLRRRFQQKKIQMADTNPHHSPNYMFLLYVVDYKIKHIPHCRLSPDKRAAQFPGGGGAVVGLSNRTNQAVRAQGELSGGGAGQICNTTRPRVGAWMTPATDSFRSRKLRAVFRNRRLVKNSCPRRKWWSRAYDLMWYFRRNRYRGQRKSWGGGRPLPTGEVRGRGPK